MIGFATADFYLQQMIVKVNEVLETIKKAFGTFL
jgi:hypothetical protein